MNFIFCFFPPLSINDIGIKIDGKGDQSIDDIGGSDIFYIRLKINSYTAIDLVAGCLSLMQLGRSPQICTVYQGVTF